MARISVCLYRFDCGNEGRRVTAFIEAASKGNQALQRALEDLINIVSADCRRHGVPSAGYGISMTLVPDGVKLGYDATNDPSKILDDIVEVTPEDKVPFTPDLKDESRAKPQ